VKFTPPGGFVRVSARHVGAETLVSVEDSGVGIAEEYQQRIFESFQQGGRGSSREEGTGLGLTLSKRLVELLGGKMWLESEVGVGSTFGFSLPGREREIGEPPTASSEAPLVGEVVVIEDDRSALELMTVYLSGMATGVTEARDGPSGLEAVRRVRPDVVLLDIRLPGIDGWAVLEALKADPATRDIPVVVVSIVDERARGVALGAAAYLVKPISRDDLRAALTTVAFLPGSPAPSAHETQNAPITGTGA
jgi:CheY-like chemotaxis protein